MTPMEQYAERLERLNGTEAAVKWERGELLLGAECDHGEEWAQLADVPGSPSEWVMRQEIRTAEAWPEAKRRQSLSWSHHFRALRVSDQEEREAWLTVAEEKGWSAHELDAQISEALDDGAAPDPGEMSRLDYAVARAKEITGRGRIARDVVDAVLTADDEWRRSRE